MYVLLTRTKKFGLIKWNFNYLNSLLVKDTHDRIFRKNTSYIPVDNGSSLNVPITIKIIALSNVTVIGAFQLNPVFFCTTGLNFLNAR